jgi:sodium transport system ATP-binding protein
MSTLRLALLLFIGFMLIGSVVALYASEGAHLISRVRYFASGVKRYLGLGDDCLIQVTQIVIIRPEACPISVIETRQLTKVFRDRKRGEVRAVDGINLRCEPGQIYGLLGANGAGKTTTLRLLATLLEPTSGSAFVAGCDVGREPEKVRSRIGFLSTSAALYGRLTARETVEYFGRLHGVQEDFLQGRIRQIFSTLGMEEFADSRCDKLSSGMKQKASIARTLIHDPQVIIFDEPTVGLDVMTARTVVQFIRDCRQKGKTVIVSTHVMSEVEKLSDRIGIIDRGRLLIDGTLAELRVQYGLADLEEIFVRVVEGRP